MEVMDRVWGVDAVFKNVWTSPMGTIVALDESPLTEGLIYAGTDDGQINVTSDGGKSWQRAALPGGVPEYTYIADLHASRTSANTVFAVFNNHKFGDYRPYLYRSDDAGKSWQSISGNLPEGEYCWAIYQDHVNPDLLFLGTEYGLYFTVDGGKQWNRFRSGIPTIAIRDLEIQTRENDLVAASFGRGFFILDDYSPLRAINAASLEEDALLFPVKNAWQYVPSRSGGGALGDTDMTSPNPEFGALITYYLKAGTQSLKQERKAGEAAKVKAGEPVYYPDWEDLAAERRERRPTVIISIFDAAGKAIQRLTGPISRGVHRVAWDLTDRYGLKVKPGAYTVRLSKVVNGVWKDLGLSESLEVVPLNNASLAATDADGKYQFLEQVSRLRSKVNHSRRVIDAVREEVQEAGSRAIHTPELAAEVYEQLHAMEEKLHHFRLTLVGNQLMTEKMELIPPSVISRLSNSRSSNGSSSDPTETQREDYRIAAEIYGELATAYNRFVEAELMPMAEKLKAADPSLTLTLDRLAVE
jgi:hypothetical protein